MSTRRTNLEILATMTHTQVTFLDHDIVSEVGIKAIGDEVKGLLTANPGIGLLLDFRYVKRLSSAALGMLISVQKLVGMQKGELKLSNIQRDIRQVFTLTSLDKVFDIYDDADDAIASFGNY